MKRILITAPLRQDVDIFEAYQDGLDRLEIPEGYEARRFFVVNDCADIVPRIRNADFIVTENAEEYRKTGDDHKWTPSLMRKMSELRNRTIREALDGGFDYWLSVDTDIVLDPKTLIWLLKADKHIVSEIFWTKHWCNAWMRDQYSPPEPEWYNPGLYRVGMTGALTLVRRSVFEAGVDYTPVPNIVNALRGEDRHFCVRAACAGFSMWVDTHVPATHLYTRAEYERFKAGRR